MRLELDNHCETIDERSIVERRIGRLAPSGDRRSGLGLGCVQDDTPKVHSTAPLAIVCAEEAVGWPQGLLLFAVVDGLPARVVRAAVRWVPMACAARVPSLRGL